MGSHRFKTGQTVSVTQLPGRFEVVRLMPESGGNYQYRLRSLSDRHERVVAEFEIV
jgi:hypothetical protein